MSYNMLMKLIIKVFEKAPVFGGLINCNGRDFWEALKEVFVVVFFSLSPIWLWVFYMSIAKASADLRWFDILADTVSHGELFLYCTSLLAPIFYIALADRQTTGTFPSKLSHIVIVVIIIILSAVFFLMDRKGEPLNQQHVFTISIILYLCSVVLIYIAKVYENNIISPSARFRHEEEEFVEQYKEHRR